MARGVLASGHDAEAVHLSDCVQGMLGDCRTCRNAAGACTIDDRYDELILEKVVHADALVIATPLYFYGMSGRLKTFFDRFSATRPTAPRTRTRSPRA